MKQAIGCRAETWRERGRWHIRVLLPRWVHVDTHFSRYALKGIHWREKSEDAQLIEPDTEFLHITFILDYGDYPGESDGDE